MFQWTCLDSKEALDRIFSNVLPQFSY